MTYIANNLWRRIQRILELPDATGLLTGHDEDSFLALRTARDRGLIMPALILSACQVSIGGGRLPSPEAYGRRYLKIQLDAFPDTTWTWPPIVIVAGSP